MPPGSLAEPDWAWIVPDSGWQTLPGPCCARPVTVLAAVTSLAYPPASFSLTILTRNERLACPSLRLLHLKGYLPLGPEGPAPAVWPLLSVLAAAGRAAEAPSETSLVWKSTITWLFTWFNSATQQNASSSALVFSWTCTEFSKKASTSCRKPAQLCIFLIYKAVHKSQCNMPKVSPWTT